MHRKAFTLIELLVVIAIVALLSGVILASLNSARDKGRLAAGRSFAAQVDHIAGDQMIGAWEFDECSGASVADRSGSNDNGTFQVTSGWSTTDTQSGIGCAGSFTGSNVVTTPIVTTESFGTNPFTISFWMKQTTAQSRACMVSTSNYSVGGWMICEGYVATDAKLFFERNITGSDDQVAAPADMPLNKWVNVVGVFDGASIIIYQDGARVASIASSAAAGSGFSLRMGAGLQGGWASYTGLLDSVHLFSKALTAMEIGRLYALESIRHPNLAAK